MGWANFIKQKPDFPEYQEIVLEDLGSTNGTRVNGDKIKGIVILNHGDVVKIGWNEFKLIDSKQKNLASTVHILQDWLDLKGLEKGRFVVSLPLFGIVQP